VDQIREIFFTFCKTSLCSCHDFSKIYFLSLIHIHFCTFFLIFKNLKVWGLFWFSFGSVCDLSVKSELQFFSAKLVTKIVHCASLCFYASSNIASQGHKTVQKTKRHHSIQ
jgi:hypothetical protein